MTTKAFSTFVKLSIIFLLFVPSLCAQQQSSIEDLRKEIQVLNQSIKSMQKDLQDIKALLQSRAPAAPSENVVLDLGNNPSQGNRAAKLTLIEFSDYQ